MVATDEVVTDLIRRGVKQRREAIEGFEKGGNNAAADKERAEILILESYLPAQMGDDELRAIAMETKTATGASSAADFGKLMGAVMAKVKGKADGGAVNRIVKEILT